MYTRVLRNKSTLLIALILALSLFAPTLPQTYADNITGTSAEGSIGKGNYFDWARDAVMSIFLTNSEDFIMHKEELNVEAQPTKSDTFNEQIKEYVGNSVSWAYGQQFRRSYVPWSEAQVQNTILFIGRTVDRNINGVVTGYNQGRDQAFYESRRIMRYPFLPKIGSTQENADRNGSYLVRGQQEKGTARGDYFLKYMTNWEGIPMPHDTEFYTNDSTAIGPVWMAPSSMSSAYKGTRQRGSGMFKKKISEYMLQWFAGETTTTPGMFFDEVMRTATDVDKAEATLLWTYISAGLEKFSNNSNITTIGGNMSSVGYRWQRCFYETNATFVTSEPKGPEPIWDNVIITESGLQERPINGGELKPLGDPLRKNAEGVYDNTGVIKQVAGYLDSLITIALMLEYNGYSSTTAGKGVIDSYIKAAKDIFGVEGNYVTQPGDLVMKNAIVLGKVQAGNWDQNGHKAMDFYDWWRSAHQDRTMRGKIAFKANDFRTDKEHRDWTVNPLLEESPTYQQWSSNGAGETMDRINLRLFMQSGTENNPTNRLYVTSRHAEIDTTHIDGATRMNGAMFYGPVAAMLGTEDEGNTQVEIGYGMQYSGNQDHLGEFSYDVSTKLPMVGAQALIGFYAAYKTQAPFTHSLHATPSEPTIVPPSDGLLNQTPILQYRLGTDFTDPPEPRAISDAQTLQSFLDSAP
jgi:hypothetical protein